MGRIAEANAAMPATARAGDAEGAGPCAEVATKRGPTAAHDGEAWTGGAARPGAGAWAPLEGLRAGQKRPAACAELSILQEANTAMPATARAGDAEGAGPCAEVATKRGPTAAHDGEAWTGGAARPGAGAWAPLEGLRAGQKRPAACAELSILQEMSASAANVDWLSSRKTGSDAIAGRPGVGAGKRAKPAKGWGISLSVPAETPPVEVRPRSPRPQPLVSRAFVAATPRPAGTRRPAPVRARAQACSAAGRRVFAFACRWTAGSRAARTRASSCARARPK